MEAPAADPAAPIWQGARPGRGPRRAAYLFLATTAACQNRFGSSV